MTPRKKYSYTKSRLFDLTTELFESRTDGRGITSAEVVSKFMTEIDKVPISEQEEIMRHGLMVLAGRVTSMNRSDRDQSDLFVKEGLPDFVDLRVPNASGKFVSERFVVKKLTPNQIVMHKPSPPKNGSPSKRDKLVEWARKQVESGHGDRPVENF